MSRRTDVPPLDEPPADDPSEVAPEGIAEGVPGLRGATADLASLSIAGLTRRRLVGIVAGLLAVWIVLMFARQVNEAAAASERVDALISANAEARTLVSALDRERGLIARQRYVEQQARAFGLGQPREIAFTLDPDAPPLPDDAPGSASVRLGADTDGVEPLERWLTVLFGPSD
jgi:cell division protein FtsB